MLQYELKKISSETKVTARPKRCDALKPPLMGATFLKKSASHLSSYSQKSILDDKQQTDMLLVEDKLTMTPDNQSQLVEELVAKLKAANELLQQEIGARRQAEAEIVQREANLLTLQYIGATTAASQDLSFALNALAHEIITLLGVEGCTIFDWDQTANQLVAVAELGRSNGDNEASLPAHPPADHPLIQRILTKCRAQQFTLSQPEIDPAGLAYLQAARLRTLLMLPMETQGHTIGIVEIKDHRIERTFSNQEVALVQLLANQAASVLENAQLYGQTQQEIAARERTAIERKKLEQALRESEEQYRRLIELSFESVVIHSQGKIIYINDQAAKLCRAASAAELIGKAIFDFVPPDYLEVVKPQVQQAGAAGQGLPFIEEKLMRLDGSSIDIEVATLPITYYGQAAIQMVLRDITGRKQAEAEQHRLLAAEHEQRLLAETLGEVFLALTAQTSHEAVLDEILRQVQRLVSYSAANIMLLEGDTLLVARVQGYEAYGSAHWFSDLRQPLHEFPLDSQVVQTRQALVIPDTFLNSQWVRTAESAWVRSFLVTPICLQDRVLGLLRLDSDTSGKFSPTDLTRLQPLTHAAAIALENARLQAQNRQLAVEQERHRLARELHDSVT